MPSLWNETIEAHRREVREAILRTTVELVAERGLLSVTMSQIAEETGIGRATLYKYFPDVESILLAWHEEQIAGHLESLATVRDEVESANEQLRAVLEAYALIHYERVRHAHHGRPMGNDMAVFLHRDAQVADAQKQVHAMIRDLLIAAADDGAVRGDISAEELSSYCLNAIYAAVALPSKAAVRRLVNVVLDGLTAPDH